MFIQAARSTFGRSATVLSSFCRPYHGAQPCRGVSAWHRLSSTPLPAQNGRQPSGTARPATSRRSSLRAPRGKRSAQSTFGRTRTNRRQVGRACRFTSSADCFLRDLYRAVSVVLSVLDWIGDAIVYLLCFDWWKRASKRPSAMTTTCPQLLSILPRSDILVTTRRRRIIAFKGNHLRCSASLSSQPSHGSSSFLSASCASSTIAFGAQPATTSWCTH
jgi:hypothetical protein